MLFWSVQIFNFHILYFDVLLHFIMEHWGFIDRKFDLIVEMKCNRIKMDFLYLLKII
jgi:hypothetical protein